MPFGKMINGNLRLLVLLLVMLINIQDLALMLISCELADTSKTLVIFSKYFLPHADKYYLNYIDEMKYENIHFIICLYKAGPTNNFTIPSSIVQLEPKSYMYFN